LICVLHPIARAQIEQSRQSDAKNSDRPASSVRTRRIARNRSLARSYCRATERLRCVVAVGNSAGPFISTACLLLVVPGRVSPSKPGLVGPEEQQRGRMSAIEGLRLVEYGLQQAQLRRYSPANLTIIITLRETQRREYVEIVIDQRKRTPKRARAPAARCPAMRASDRARWSE
jgi:hypothetical protein